MDSPAELSAFTSRTFTVEREFRVALHHDGSDADADRFTAALGQIVRETRAVFGELPSYEEPYTFIVDYLPWAQHDGMEHRNSTILTEPARLRVPDEQLGALGTAAHEFLHSWNVERLRPRSLEPIKLDAPNPSGELWFVEGFNQYYGPLITHRCGITGIDDLAASLGYSLVQRVAKRDEAVACLRKRRGGRPVILPSGQGVAEPLHGGRRAGEVAAAGGDGERRFQQRHGAVEVVLPDREPARPPSTPPPAAPTSGSPPGSARKVVSQARADDISFVADEGERAEDRRESEAAGDVAALAQPAEHRLDVAQFRDQTLERRVPVGLFDRRKRPLRDREAPVCQAVEGSFAFARRGQLVQREGADRFEQPVARAARRLRFVLDQTLVDQRRDRAASSPATSCAPSKEKPSAKTPRRRKKSCSAGVRQVVAPGDRGAERLVAVGRVDGAAAEVGQGGVEPSAEDGRRQGGCLSGGQLDRQGQSVELAADRRDVGGVGRGQREARRDRLRPLDEETHRGVDASGRPGIGRRARLAPQGVRRRRRARRSTGGGRGW